MTLSTRYAPLLLKDFVQQGVLGFEERMRLWKKGKAIILLGPTGSGKSSSVYAYAREKGLDVVEQNASDFRNADAIKEIIGNAVSQGSLFGRGKIVLLDDVDGISGNEDRGGIPALVKVIESSRVPIVMTAIDLSDKKFSPLKKVGVVVSYPAVPYLRLAEFLQKVCLQEKISAEPDALKMLARMSEGDVRAALNDLQSLAALGSVTKAAVQEMPSRDRMLSLAEALLRIFKTKDVQIALHAVDNLDEDIDQLFLWVEENIPKEYTKAKDLARALDSLAEADKYRGRIRRWQYWRFQVYCYALLSVGVALAKEEKYAGASDIQQSSRLLKIWIANQKNLKRKSIAGKMRSRLHTSSSRIVDDALPFIRVMMKEKSLAKDLSTYFGFDKEDVLWLTK
jgi:replication factor C large subunit